MFKPQRSFHAGEISEDLHARADTDKYQAGCKTLTNFVIQKFGGAVRRSGTEYIGECGLTYPGRLHDQWGYPRLIPWNATSDIGYVLEFGHKRLRVIRNGQYVKVSGGWAAIDSINSGTGIVTLNSKPKQIQALQTNNALVEIKGVWAEAPELHNKVVRATSVTTGAKPTFVMKDFAGNTVTGSTVSALGWVEVLYEIATPIPLKAAREMRYSMADGVMTLTHNDMPVLEVSKGRGNDKWTVTAPFTSDANVRIRSTQTGESVKLLPPTSVTTDAYAEYTDNQVNKDRPWKRYCVTTVDGDGNESLPRYSNYVQKNDGDEDADAIANSVRPNSTFYALSGVSMDFDSNRGRSGGRSAVKVVIGPDQGTSSSIRGNQKFTIAGRDYFGNDVTETIFASSFEGDGSTTEYRVLNCYSVNYYRDIRSIRTDHYDASRYLDVGWVDWDWNNVTLSWPKSTSVTHAPTPVTYRVYRSDGGLFGLIGTMTSQQSDGLTTVQFIDADRPVDYTTTPPVIFSPFPNTVEEKAYKFNLSPLANAHYQQRRVMAGSDRYGSRVWASGIGRLGDYNTKHILTARDPFYFDLGSAQFQNIMHILSLNKLVLFTDSGEWLVEGDEAGSISPTTINARQMSYFGSGHLAPAMVGNDAVFYQERGSIVRDLGYTFSGKADQSDLTMFASHLHRNFQIKAWAYQRSPNSILWCVRDDGTLLSLTYVKEHQITAWTKHELGGDGAVRDVVVVPEGASDSVYVVVERGALSEFADTRKYFVERLTETVVADTVSHSIVDACVRQNGWRSDSMSCGTMTIDTSSGSYGYSVGSTCLITMEQPYFDSQTDFIQTKNKTRTVQPSDIDFVENYVNSPMFGMMLHYGTTAPRTSVQFNNAWKYKNNKAFYDTLKDTGNLVAGKKVVVGSYTDKTTASLGSIGQVIRPGSSRHAYLTSGGWTGQPRLKITKVISRTTAEAEILGVELPSALRNTALHTWTFAGIHMRDDAINITEIASGGFAVGASVTVNCRCGNFPASGTASNYAIHLGDPTTPSTNCIINITAITNSTTAVGTVTQAAVPVDARGTINMSGDWRNIADTADFDGTYKWGRASKVLYGLTHLIGEDISVYADGQIQSSPWNSDYPTVTVAPDGTATIATPAVVWSAGLPYTSDLETLEVDQIGAGSLGDKQIIVNKVTAHFKDSQGGHIGSDLPSGSTATTNMTSIYLDTPGVTTVASTARTGKYTTIITSDWGSNGKVAIRNVDPTPMTVLAVHPNIVVTSRGNPR